MLRNPALLEDEHLYSSESTGDTCIRRRSLSLAAEHHFYQVQKAGGGRRRRSTRRGKQRYSRITQALHPAIFPF